jgi:hypothetical protein
VRHRLPLAGPDFFLANTTAALDEKQRDLLTTLETVDIDAPIDWDGTPFTFALFTWESVQHEVIHHGQWSIYHGDGQPDVSAISPSAIVVRQWMYSCSPPGTSL